MSNEDDAELELVLNDDADRDRLSITKNAGILNFSLNTISVPKQIKQRYASTNIANTVLWTLTVIITLTLLGGDNIVATIVAALISVGVAINVIFSIIKQVKKQYDS